MKTEQIKTNEMCITFNEMTNVNKKIKTYKNYTDTIYYNDGEDFITIMRDTNGQIDIDYIDCDSPLEAKVIFHRL